MPSLLFKIMMQRHGGGIALPYVPVPDTEAPTVPEFAFLPLNGQILVAFETPPTDNVAISHTTLERSDDGGDSWVTLTNNWVPPLFDSGLSPLVLYTYRATVYDTSGNFTVVTGQASPQADTADPTITSFVIPATSASLTIPITEFTATDAYSGVAGYLITETATPPALDNPNWSATAPTEYTVATQGAKTLYGWVKDAAGNITDAATDSCTVDIGAPTVTAFAIPATHDTLNIPISTFTASDNVGVTGYIITQSATPPSLADPNWTGTAPATYTVVGDGNYTLYPWARDFAGNISPVATPDSCAVSTAAPTPTHYVDVFANVTGATSDSDTVSGTAFASATSPATPCTLGEAFANATAGDVVQVAPGVYTGVGQGDKFTPAFAPANSGTLGSRIIFMAEYPAAYNRGTPANLTELRHDGIVGDVLTQGPVLGSVRNYITLSGFYCDESQAIPAADTGSVTLGNQGAATIGNIIEKCWLKGYTPTHSTWSGVPDANGVDENNPGIRIEGAGSPIVRYNYIQDYYNPGGSHNACGIQSYAYNVDIDDANIHNNYITHCGAGVYIKGQVNNVHSGIQIFLNHIVECTHQGIEFFMVTGATRNVISRNLIKGDATAENSTGIAIGNQCTAAVDVINNTVYNCSNCYVLNDTVTAGSRFMNNTAWDNILFERSYVYLQDPGADGVDFSVWDMDNNLYQDPADYTKWQIDGVGTVGTFAAWQTAVSDEANSAVIASGTTVFTDTATEDFTIPVGSPAEDFGVDVLDILGGGTSGAINAGCYVNGDTVGL